MTRRIAPSFASRTVVAVLVLAVVSAAIGSAWIALVSARSAMVSEVQQGEAFAAQERAAALGDRVDQALARVSSSASEPLVIKALVERDIETLETGVTMLAPVAEITNVTVRDADGAVLATYPDDDPPLDASSSDVQVTDEGVGVLVSNELVRDERGQIVGSLQAATPITDVMPRLLETPALPEALVSLVARDGTILASKASAPGGRVSVPELLDVVATGEAGIAEYHSDLLGSDRLAAVAPVPGRAWSIVVAADRDAAYAPARSLSVRLGTVVGIAVLVIVAGLVGIGLVVRRHRRTLLERHAAAERLAATDPLTGLGNRRALDAAVGALEGGGVAALVIDVDDFKTLNDTFGHDAGDRALQAIAGALRGAVRAQDTVVRTGGDEFVVLLPGGDVVHAERTGVRIRDAVDATGAARVSVGVGASSDGDVTAAMLAADEALYVEKRGRHVTTASR